MKNIFLSAAFITLCAFGGFAQKLVPLITFGGTDTTISIYEGLIWKVDNQTGDSTSVVSYVNVRGDETTINSDTNEAKILTLSDRLFTPTGLGYTINADRVKAAYRLTDSTSFIIYQRGNGGNIQINLNSLSVSEFNALLNAL